MVAGLWGEDAELYFRRGHTHGVLAIIVLPLLLAGAIALWHRVRSRWPCAPDAPPFRPRIILALAFLAVLSHPLLDWLNTYGVRLLMPFDGRWFYGDTLFIIDPWFWLLMAAGVMLARSATRLWIARWSVLALAASALILSSALVSPGVKVAWCVGLAILIAIRIRRPAWAASMPVARAGLAVLLVYVGTVHVVARIAEARVAERFPAALQVQANVVPGEPFAHRYVVVEEDRYRILTPEGAVHEVPRLPADVIVRTALEAEEIRGFANWTRFPSWSVEEEAGYWLVTFRDLRYLGPDLSPRGIGFAEVKVRKND